MTANNEEPGGRTEYGVSPQRFVEVWQRSKSLEEVSAALGMPKPIVLARKSKYTKDGVLLKKMPRKNADRSLDVDRLNAIIARLNQTGQNPTADTEASPINRLSNSGQEEIDRIVADLQGHKNKTG